MKKNNGARISNNSETLLPLKVAALGKVNILISCCYCLVYISKGKKAKVKLAILWSLLRGHQAFISESRRGKKFKKKTGLSL
jgi:hypothetical protein